MTDTQMVLAKPDPELSQDKLRLQMAAAQRFVDSGLLPGSIKTPQQALLIMEVGREIGVPNTYALRNIHVVNGRPVISAELLMALIRRTYGPGSIRVAKTSADSCVVQYREAGWDGVSEYEFGIEDAKRAGLTSKSGPWSQYPAAMLRARAISAVARMAFPEAIAGLYTPEELGAEVTVTDDGAVEFAAPVDDTERQDLLADARALAGQAVVLGLPGSDRIASTDFGLLDTPQLSRAVSKLSRMIADAAPGETPAIN